MDVDLDAEIPCVTLRFAGWQCPGEPAMHRLRFECPKCGVNTGWALLGAACLERCRIALRTGSCCRSCRSEVHFDSVRVMAL